MLNKEVEQQNIESQNSLKKYAKENGFDIPEILEYKFIAIGYLSIDEDFEKGDVSQNFLNKLRILYEEGGMSGHLGHHECEFCIDEGNYENRGMSSCEKELTDKENKVRYKFPEMIFHYITNHHYLPPLDFIKFVMGHN